MSRSVWWYKVLPCVYNRGINFVVSTQADILLETKSFACSTVAIACSLPLSHNPITTIIVDTAVFLLPKLSNPTHP